MGRVARERSGRRQALAPLKRALEAQARALGFCALGVARATRLGPEGEQLRAWLAAGYHGEMAYMQRHAAVRRWPRHPGMLPTAHSVVMLAWAYPQQPHIDLGPGRVAKYAGGRDYHRVLGKALRCLAVTLEEAGYRSRAGVDSLPIFERAWAVRAGLGFVGKNCCLIIPGVGSHVFLGALVTEAPLPVDRPQPSRCGSCRLCLDVCPTRAFVGPGQLDARRCIAYLTIESRQPMPEPLRQGVGDWLFGCDACQDICPYNRGQRRGLDLGTLAPFKARPALAQSTAAQWLELDEATFDALTLGSPLRRAKREGLAANAAIVLGNAGGPAHETVLARASETHPSARVREHAAWARAALRRRLRRDA